MIIPYYVPGSGGATIFLPSGGVIDFNTADVTITHSSNTLTFDGATSGYVFNNKTFLYLPVATYAGNQTLSTQECQGGVVTVTATATITLPAVDSTKTGLCVTIYSTTAAVVHIDANASDRIVLNGTALDEGDKISCDAVAGNYVILLNDANTGWRTVGMSGVWVDGGA